MPLLEPESDRGPGRRQVRRLRQWAGAAHTATGAFWQDLRYAARSLRRSPGFTAIAVVSLALGIGANTAIFSVIDRLMLRPLPVDRPEQLVELLSRYPGEPRLNTFWWRHYEHFRDHSRSFTALTAVARGQFLVRSDRLEPATVDGEYVAGNFFPALGVPPLLGRVLDERDDRVDSPTAASAVISWSFWTRRLAGNPAAIGTVIVVNGVPVTIVGVTPREFFGLQVGMKPSLWLPAAAEAVVQKPSRRLDGTLMTAVVGRVRPGVALDQVRAEMRQLDRFRAADLAKARQSAATVRELTLDVEPAAAGLAALRDRFATALVVLMAVVAVILLIACTNSAGLLVARGAARQGELAVRISLGASRGRLVRHVLSESLLLAVAGSAIGVALAYGAAGALVRTIASGREFQQLQQSLDLQVHPDPRVFLFTAAMAILTALLFSIAPAWHAMRAAPAAALRSNGGGETRSRHLFGKGLVVAQVALTFVLLSAAGLFVRHLSDLRNQDFGFERTSLLLVTLDPANGSYAADSLFEPYQQLLGRLGRIPGVRSAAVSGITPISGAGASRFIEVEGFDEPPDARRFVPLNWIGPGYFQTFGTPFVSGRDFTFADRGGRPVAIVNRAMARYYFGDTDPIGRRFQLVGRSNSGVTGAPPDQVYEIVGVVGDAKYLDLRQAPPRTIYLHAFQEPRMFANRVALRVIGSSAAVASDVRRVVGEDLKGVPVTSVMTMDDLVDASVVPERVIAGLSTFFGGVGALLAALGVHGLLAYTITRRTGEFGIRVALGATVSNIIGMVLRGAFGLVLAGLALGVPLAVVVSRLSARVVPDLPADTAWPSILAAASLLAIACLAAYVPARRAAAVNPVAALRP